MRTPLNYFGTIGLVLAAGLAVNTALQPFEHPRDIYFNEVGNENEESEVEYSDD